MDLFHLFKKSNVNSPAHEDWANAKKMYDRGEYEDSLYALAPGFKKDVDYLPLYRLAADTATHLDAPNARALFTAVSENPHDADVFDQLANMYFGGNDFELAQIFLEKAVELNPNNNGALYDLALCYAHQQDIGKAIETLKKAQSPDFWLIYLLNKFNIFTNDIEGVQESVQGLEQALAEEAEDSETDVKRYKVEELQETLQRYLNVKEPKPHIRDWQYIQYGSVVLDCYDNADCPTGGRYASASGSHESIKALADKLKQLTDTLSVNIQGVAALPDRDSEIVGRVVAKILDVSFSVYDDENPAENHLIVAAHTVLFDDYYELNTISSGQILFAACHNWQVGTYVCPDIIGFMAQAYLFPWEDGSIKVIDIEKRLFETLVQDDRAPETIAEAICSSHAAADPGAWLAFYAEQKASIKGIGHLAGKNRYNFMVESPVTGAYFT